ncbi:MAG: MBL fold metallo-hydrolase [Candidatus Atabeyarchaeum deiterrae]
MPRRQTGRTSTPNEEELKFEVLWYDSLGAKSSSILVETPDVSVLIDPGASGMQHGFPMSRVKKAFYRLRALRKISGAAHKAKVIVISHYHYDHFCRLDLKSVDSAAIYRGKKIFVKDPNKFVNFSQWARARAFFSQILKKFNGEDKAKKVMFKADPTCSFDAEDSIPLAMGKDFKDYQERRNEFIEKGRIWFASLCRMWSKNPWISEMKFGDTEFKFMDGRKVEFGNTVLRFSPPFFHGVEYDRLGWVSSTLIEHKGVKLIHTSDVEGPVIEDYADWIIRENPNVVFVDGPPTYLLGFVVNKVNLTRAIDNVCRIIREADRTELVIYDHHLMRDPLFQKRAGEVYKAAKINDKRVMSAAEFLGQEIVALKVGKASRP